MNLAAQRALTCGDFGLHIHVKRVYEAPSPHDGSRILVDRVWPRGLSKEAAQLTCWMKDIAPSSWLRRWFHHDPMRWQEFIRRYRSELAANEGTVQLLLHKCLAGPVTLVYAARDTEHNHAHVLVDYLTGLGGDGRGGNDKALVNNA